jgi:hypothetical protein
MLDCFGADSLRPHTLLSRLRLPFDRKPILGLHVAYLGSLIKLGNDFFDADALAGQVFSTFIDRICR